MKKDKFLSSRGFPFPFGPSKHAKGFNFALFSKHAKKVSLCLFEPHDCDKIFSEIPLDPLIHKTGDVWHIFIYDLPSDFHYGYRLEGEYDPIKGFYYDNRLVMLDPYCKQLATSNVWGEIPQKTIPCIKGIVSPLTSFDWGDDKHPQIPMNELIIYEMHVRGFTQDPSSSVKHPGTFMGIIEKIPYLKSLGVNAVELLPLHEFYERHNPFINPKTGKPLFQYWGYDTMNFFAPMNRYGTDPMHTLTEFKMLVKALHDQGIEVILDVVYNHTAEGNQEGSIFSFKGIENPTYYMLGPDGSYYNFSGCGNTLNCNHPVVREYIRDTLRYYVLEMHVDGFRFDLASVLSRSHDGIVLDKPPVLEMIAKDPILANTKLIAEAWDAGGLYQVGTFPGYGAFAEWNGHFRDSVRRFIKGTEGAVGNFATRLSGSEDLYGKGRSPEFSINYITCHDGFSLADLVSYNEKHNEENGENNCDGNNENDSWNCGFEGETEDPNIQKLRQRQMRNFHLALMVSQGVPMVLMGDEYGHTKKGNNNTWGHDSRLNWFQWDSLEKNPQFFHFFQAMIGFRKKHPILMQAHFLRNDGVIWHGKELGKADWSAGSRFLALSLPDKTHHYELFIAFNAHFTENTCQLPPGAPWKRIVDTSQESPHDFCPEEKAPAIPSFTYLLPPYSSLLLKRPLP